jgi:hypothetical protein
MKRSWKSVALVTSVGLAGALSVAPASAHISLDQGNTQKSRDGDANLKEGPCGKAGSTRGTNIYTYAPGQVVPVNIIEFIPHPSYFRIAFDNAGDDAFKAPASIKPIDPTRPCPFNAADKCGASDFYNNSAVLPNMDDLDPHIPTAFVSKSYTWNVTMPNVECDNCTLQIIQVMEDTIHGAYNPVPGDPADVRYTPDIYHQCIDLVLAREGGTGAAATDAGKSGAAPSNGSSGSSGSCTIGRRAPGSEPSSSVVLLCAAAAAATLGRRSGRRVSSR